jgi:hypothetical protein
MMPCAGLELDPSNEQLRQGLQEARRAKEGVGTRPGPGGPGSLFGPEFLGRLATNPQTRHLLQEPDFLQMLQDLGRNPSNMNKCASGLHRPEPKISCSRTFGQYLWLCICLVPRSGSWDM